MLRKSLIINNKDSVAMVLEDSNKGDRIRDINDKEIILLENVKFAHKVALLPLKKGTAVIKYGEEIGYMLTDVMPGMWIHNHNMGCERGKKRGEA